MNCLEFRQVAIADPHRRERDFVEHIESCRKCGSFHADLQDFDRVLAAATRVKTPADLVPALVLQQSLRSRIGGAFARRALYPLAACVVFAMGLVVGLHLQTVEAGSGMEQAIVTYINNQHTARNDDAILADHEVNAVLAPFGMRLASDVGEISYATRCFIRDKEAAHLVVAGDKGPITVLIMPNDWVDNEKRLEFGGFSALILPCPKGSMALVGQRGERLEPTADLFTDAVVWL